MTISKKTLLPVLLATAMPLTAGAQAIDTPPSGYTLVWSDEFNADQLDETNWNIEVNGNGGGNQELQYYRRENVSMGTDPKSGEKCLVLTARRESFGGRSFTSGRVTTQNKSAFKHGMIQARIKFPKTKDGLWPAYWMMGNDMNKYGWPRCGEMDIIEMGHFNGINNGTQDRYFGGTLHYGPDASNEHHQQLSQDYLASEDNPVSNDEYHIFTVEWDDANLYMYYDLEGYTAAKKRQARYFSTSVASSNDVMSVGNYFQKPFFFLFNLAVGGWFTNIFDPAMITALPNEGDEAKMYVDWVRVYQADADENALFLYTDAEGNKQTNIPEDPEPPKQDDNKTELSGFATAALDENGVSTFDFADGYDYVLVSTSQGVTGNCYDKSNVVADYNVDNVKNFLYLWDNTYVAVNREGRTNSFGWDEGYSMFTVASAGWSGLGFASSGGNGKDLTMLDDSYWLHFAMKANDVEQHASHTVIVGDAQFIIGNSDGKLATIGDFKRDGEWYYFDIPVKAIRQFADPVFPAATAAAYEGNLIAFMSGGITDTELSFDNVFFYKSHSKEVPTYTDNSAELGRYGYKSLDEDGRPVFDFATTDDVVPLVLSGDMWENLTAGGTYTESVVVKEHDMTEQAGKNNFFIWGDPQTLTAKAIEGIANSFGNTPYGGVSHLASVIGTTWNGAGYASISGAGNTVTNKDLSMLDDTYYIHFSLRSDAAVSHIPVSVKIGGAELTFGNYGVKPLFADFNRDGEWYSFDIPLAELRKFAYPLFPTDDDPVNGKGTIDNYRDYVLVVNTGSTFYSGSHFAIDNVFFFKKKEGEAPEVNELGDYTTKSLDADGKSYFDFAGKDFIIFSTNGSVTGKMLDNGSESILLDCRDGVGANKFNNWQDGNSYQPGTQTGSVADSFGGDEGWLDFTTNGGWTGAGFINGDGIDLSLLDDGNWHLHFAMRGTDECSHQIGFGEAKFTIGFRPFGEGVPVLGNYKRDGEWYSFDIPFDVVRSLNTNIFPNGNGGQTAYRGNLIWFMSGGGQGDEIQLDNIFFWRDKSSVSAIEGVPAAGAPHNAATAIYDLTGRKVQGMTKPGLYIVRSANGVKKVAVK